MERRGAVEGERLERREIERRGAVEGERSRSLQISPTLNDFAYGLPG
jgi:hypothetical protein